MTKTLFLAWQDKRYQATDASATRQWFPIGRLDADSGGFVFRYTHGAKRAQQQAGFHPLTAFPQMDKRYVSDRLFELFRNRVPRPSRTDYAAYLDRLGLPSNVTDPFEILSVSGGRRTAWKPSR